MTGNPGKAIRPSGKVAGKRSAMSQDGSLEIGKRSVVLQNGCAALPLPAVVIQTVPRLILPVSTTSRYCPRSAIQAKLPRPGRMFSGTEGLDGKGPDAGEWGRLIPPQATS